jgi:hypothetical protein
VNESIKELVEQAKFETTIRTHVINGPTQIFFGNAEVIQKFAALVAEAERKAEREACKKECDEIAERFGGTARDCAEAIRARGSK